MFRREPKPPKKGIRALLGILGLNLAFYPLQSSVDVMNGDVSDFGDDLVFVLLAGVLACGEPLISDHLDLLPCIARMGYEALSPSINPIEGLVLRGHRV